MKIKLSLVAMLCAILPLAAQASTSTCQDMVGEYTVPTYDAPLGLLETSRIVFADDYELGTPAFEVLSNKEQFTHHGLYSGTLTNVRPAPLTGEHSEFFGLFGDTDITCSYELSHDFKMIQVDLSKQNDVTLEALRAYIAKSWGSAVLDMGRAGDFERLTSEKQKSARHPYNIEALRKTHYFSVMSVDITGVISYAILVPLDKK